jgi:hypothetical protein
MQSIEWGLKSLGHSVTYAVNNAEPDSINIIFGAQVLPISFLKQLPKNSIVYNLEQIRGRSKDQIEPEQYYLAGNFQIWEYSTANLSMWEFLKVKKIKIVPIGYAPLLTRIPKPRIQDIDVLIYGLTGEKRLNIFHEISNAGLSTIFASGFYGDTRDQLIARSKIIVNVNLYDKSQIFEVARVSYLLANKKAVIATLDPNTFIENDLSEAVKFVTPDKILQACNDLLTNTDDRADLEKRGFEKFIKRDVKSILSAALTE